MGSGREARPLRDYEDSREHVESIPQARRPKATKHPWRAFRGLQPQATKLPLARPRRHYGACRPVVPAKTCHYLPGGRGERERERKRKSAF